MSSAAALPKAAKREKSMVGSRLRHRFVIENLGAGDARTTVLHTSSFQTLASSDDFLTTSKDYYTSARPSPASKLLSPAWQPQTTVGDKIPGLRTSAAFLSSLRTNLRLNDCPPPSPLLTPDAMRTSTSSLSESLTTLPDDVDGHVTSAQTNSNKDNDPLAGVPTLQSYIAEDVDDKTAALKLVADGVAQMRQTASKTLIFHPINLAALIAFCAFLGQYLYTSNTKYGDPWLIFTTTAGVVMTYLISIRLFTGGYLEEAEKIKEPLLEGADVFVTKFGDEVIGTVIMALVPSENKGKRRKTYVAEVRGWNVRLKYRGKGVGMALLEDAVAEAKKRGVEDIYFPYDHPNSPRLLWSMYNGPFDRSEARARQALQNAWETQPKGRKK